MAVDRGGLRYTITVEDRFSKQITRLKSQLKSLEGDLTRVSTARARFNATQSQNTSGTDAATAAVQRQGRAQAAVGRQTVASQRSAQAALRGTQRQLGRTGAAARRAVVDVNNLGFSFRRLIGIFAAFQAARIGANLFGSAISGGVRFNQTVEDAQIAMASLFTTVGRVRDAQGQLVSGANAFAIAQGIAAEQTRLLRIDAIQTTATFVELQKAFQSGIGPGLEAGLKIDEIREVTVRISQAAAALNIAQNQLTEEIRSLLRGTIQARTTVVASVLGITNEDIRNAKEAGNLFEFLREKLDGFRFAALATQQSFSGLAARLRDTFSVATGAAAEEFFNELKVSLGEISTLFVTLERNAEGAVTSITPKPETVAVFREIFDALREGVIIVREGLAQVTFDELASSFKGLGNIFRSVASLFSGLIQGITRGFGTASTIVNNLVKQLGGMEAVLPVIEQIGVFLGKWGTLVLAVVTSLALINKSIALIAIPARILVGILSGMASLALRMAIGFAAAPLPLLVLVAALSAGLFVLNGWVKEVAGFQVRFGTLVTIIKDGLFNVLVLVAAKLREVFLGTFESVVIEGISATIAATIQLLQGALRKIATAIAAIPLPFSGVQATAIRGLASGLDSVIEKLDKISSKSVEAHAALEAATAAAAKQVIDDFDAALADDPQAFDLGASIEDNVQKAVELLKGLIGPDLVDVDKIREAVEKAVIGGVEGANKTAETPLQKFAQGMVDSIESGITIARIAVNEFAQFATDLIIDAFDPSKEVDLTERFRKLFQNIVKAIIAELVKLAIAKTILSLTGEAEGGQVGKAQGGQIHHAHPRGFDAGGVVPGGHFSTPQFRPESVAKSDTVNAWLTPKEFVQPVNAVTRYGADLMELMRRGAVDPSALRAVAGLNNKRAAAIVSSSAHRGRGYAAGGAVDRSDVPPIARANDTNIVAATVVGNDLTMDRLLSGGKKSMLDFMQDNSATIDGILSKNRTR